MQRRQEQSPRHCQRNFSVASWSSTHGTKQVGRGTQEICEGGNEKSRLDNSFAKGWNGFCQMNYFHSFTEYAVWNNAIWRL